MQPSLDFNIQEKNCLTCSRFIKCRDIDKSYTYVCEKFKRISMKDLTRASNYLVDPDKGSSRFDFEALDDKEEKEAIFDLNAMLDKVFSEVSPMPKDLKIDDSDLPVMPNFYSFCFDRRYGFTGMRPFARQLWIYSKLFGEICPKCTKPKYYNSYENIPVDLRPSKFSSKVQLMEHGVCPKCKSRKSKLHKKGLLNIYTELAQCCGQRCIVGESLVLTQDGLVRIDSYAKRMEFGFNDFALNVHNAKSGFETTSDFYVSKPEHTIKIVTEHGYELEGTSDHPVYLIDKFEKLKDVVENDYVKIKYNTQVYGNKITIVGTVWLGENRAYALGLDINTKPENERVPDSILQGSKFIQSAFLRGYFEGAGCVKESSVTCTSQSKSLIYEINAMLLNMGIVSVVSESLSRDTAQSTEYEYSLSIFGSDFLTVFDSEVGFASDRKKSELKELIRRSSEHQLDAPYCTDRLPDIIKHKFIDFVGSLGYLIFPTQDQKRETREETLCESHDLEDVYERLSEPNVALTVTKAKIFFDRIDEYENLLSEEDKCKYTYLKDIILEPNCFYSKVVKVSISEKPKITYDFTLPETHQFWSNGFVSHNSGKSIGVSFGAAYITHRTLKLQNPAKLYTGLSNQSISGSVVSLSLKNVMKLLWGPIVDALEDSLWFQEYHAMLDYYSNKFGEELYRHKDTFLHYKHRKMILNPEVPNKRTLRGSTRFFYAIDELGWFDAHDTDKITISGEETWKSLDRSCLTARNASRTYLLEGYDNVPTAYALNVSSPSDQNDMITRLVNTNRHSDTVLAIQSPTWEMNPKVPRDDPEIVKAYAVDPISAERDYGAVAPMNAAPFFENYPAIQKAFDKKRRNKVLYSYEHKKSKNESKEKVYRYAKITKIRGNAGTYSSVMAIDAGYSNNGFSLSVGHREDKDTIFDVIVDIMPERGKNVLNHALIFEEIVKPIIKEFNVKIFSVDRWNSLLLIHQLEEEFPQLKVCEQYSVKYDDFVLFKSYLEGGKIRLPKLEIPFEDAINVRGAYPHIFDYKPSAHLAHQLVTVQDKKRSVDKAKDRTDDILRSMVLACKYLLDPKLSTTVLKEKKVGRGGIVALSGSSATSGNSAKTSSGGGLIAKC